MANNVSWPLSEDAKKGCRALRATFVMAPREMSKTRLVELVKPLLEKGHVIFGAAGEPYVDGFDGQAQFRTLPGMVVEQLADVIAKAGLAHKFFVLTYPQADVDDVIRALRPNKVIVVRGSYEYVFHRRSTFALLEKRGIPFEYASPFSDETEAKQYLAAVENRLPADKPGKCTGGEREMFRVVDEIAKRSFDYSFQTGAVLAEKTKKAYALVDAACNEVVPYQTYALLHGNSREDNLSPRHDANHYDTIHAEMNLLIRAMKTGISFVGKTLFINMLPCPSCARTLVQSGLGEVVYREVHSDGYAVGLFEKAGMKTRKAGTV